MEIKNELVKRRRKPKGPSEPSLLAQNRFLRGLYGVMLNDAGAQKFRAGWLGG